MQNILYNIYIYMGVSKNNGTPKSSILIGFYIINHPFWGTTIFGNTHIPIDRHFSQLLSYWKPWFPAQAPRHKHHEWLFNLTEERPTSQFFSMVKNGVMVEVRYKGIAFGKQLDIFEICWYRDYIYIYGVKWISILTYSLWKCGCSCHFFLGWPRVESGSAA